MSEQSPLEVPDTSTWTESNEIDGVPLIVLSNGDQMRYRAELRVAFGAPRVRRQKGVRVQKRTRAQNIKRKLRREVLSRQCTRYSACLPQLIQNVQAAVIQLNREALSAALTAFVESHWYDTFIDEIISIVNEHFLSTIEEGEEVIDED